MIYLPRVIQGIGREPALPTCAKCVEIYMLDNHRGARETDRQLLGHCDVLICIFSQGSLRHMQI